MNKSVLLIDDDASFCVFLRLVLSQKGLQVYVAHDAISALRKVYSLKPDVILLDVMLPEMDGWQACRRIRELSNIPVIMLTALGSAKNVVHGLDLGADDYMVKPVAANELVARIHALLRRADQSDSPGEDRASTTINCDNLVIDLGRHKVTVDGKPVDLTPTEFRLLSVLARHKGRVLPHEYLLREVWGPDHVEALDYLRLYISYLRRKIGRELSRSSLIHSEWGIGYRFG
jgi:two-component system KDP operon response regulator KdpE